MSPDTAWNERETLADLYREFHPRVLSVCRAVLRSPEEAEDASSEVFARLPRAMQTYDRALSFPRWLAGVASHYCIDRLRKRRSEQRVIEPAHADTPEPRAASRSPLEELLSAEERETVRLAIARLPQHYRAPLVLRYYEDLTYDEIGERLGLKRAHVATLIFRAKEQMRKSLTRKQADARPAAGRRRRAWVAAAAH